jgi:hypothetical protein
VSGGDRPVWTPEEEVDAMLTLSHVAYARQRLTPALRISTKRIEASDVLRCFAFSMRRPPELA